MLESSIGVGGCGVPESNCSGDDMFTDEQPDEELIRQGKGESVPLLDVLNSYGEYGDFKLVGHGEVTNEYCGNFRRFTGCNKVHLHDVVDLNGVNYHGKVFVRRAYHWCNKPSCPKCMKSGWAVRQADSITARLKEGSKRFGAVEHIVMSVPKKDYGLPLEVVRKKAWNGLKARGVIGACLIFHAFRYKAYRGWYYSPHFHALGFILGGYAKCRKCRKHYDCTVKGSYQCGGFIARSYKEHQKDKFVCKVLGERKTIFGTAWYQLNHASYDKTKTRFHVATWFGCVSYCKMKVTKEKKKELCPICQSELVHLRCLVNLSNVKAENDTHFERDTFEDYVVDGEVAWIEVPKNKKWVAVARNLLTPEDFATPVSQEWIDEMFPKRMF